MAYGFLMAALSIFLLLLRRIYCHRYYVECVLKIRHYYDKPLLKEMGGFAGWSLLGSSSSMLTNYGQGIIINIFFGTAVNAAQGIANQISGQLSVFSNTLVKALNPLIDKSEGAGNRLQMFKAVMFGSKISFFLLMIFYVPVIIEMDFILKIWLKNIPEYCVIFCKLLLMRDLIGCLFVTLTSSIYAVGNIKKFQISSSILTFLPLIISSILFYLKYPPVALYIVFLIYTVLMSSLILFFAKKVCEFSVFDFIIKVLLKCFVIFIIVFATGYFFNSFINAGIKSLIIVSLISGLASLGLILFYGFTSNERKLVLQIINKIIFNKNEKFI
jgi:O-antigen/teichoic acid export membrane protein